MSARSATMARLCWPVTVATTPCSPTASQGTPMALSSVLMRSAVACSR